jgi:hypothetical protein
MEERSMIIEAAPFAGMVGRIETIPPELFEPLGKWPTVDIKGQFLEFAAELRAFVPVPGTDYEYLYQVLVPFEDERKEHGHSWWVALCYVDLGDPPVAVIVEGERIVPTMGDVVVLPPVTKHAVEPSQSERMRLSVAMLVKGPRP